MKVYLIAVAPFASLLSCADAFAAEPKVVISSPHDGTIFGPGDAVTLVYEAVPGRDDDHLHLNVDGTRMDTLRAMSGKIPVGMLPLGKHRICLTINTRANTPTGVAGCVNVIVQ